MKECMLLLPNQLAEHIPQNVDVYLIEEPILYNCHKLKISFLRAVCLASKHKERLVDFKDVDKFLKELANTTKYTSVKLYDPLDNQILDKYKKIFKNKLVIMVYRTHSCYKNHI